MYDVKLIKELMTSAGERAMKYYRKVTPTWKANKTYVTEADLEVQAFLKTELERRFPDDGLIGEENDLSKEASPGGRYWIIDPVDGTASFARGVPIWGIAVGLFSLSDAIGGFFHIPTTGDFYYSTPEGQVFRNDLPVSIGEPDPASREAVMLTWPKWYKYYAMSPAYPGKVRSLGSTIAHICYVATGSADVAFVQRCAVWDLAAGLALLLHNGGVLEFLDGTPVSIERIITDRESPEPMLAGRPDAVRQYRTWLSPRSELTT